MSTTSSAKMSITYGEDTKLSPTVRSADANIHLVPSQRLGAHTAASPLFSHTAQLKLTPPAPSLCVVRSALRG